MHSERASIGLRLAAWGGLVFLHFPILIIVLYAFTTEDAAFSFPPRGFTLKWFSVAFSRPDVLESITLSLQVACLATLIALVLGAALCHALWNVAAKGAGGDARGLATAPATTTPTVPLPDTASIPLPL